MVFFMKKYALLRYCLVFLAIVLPYFSAATINGPERVLAERVPDMEEYLPVIVFSQISPDMKKDDIYYLRVRGSGHGVGFSQFGGNEMAKNGSSAEEILKKYFPEMELKAED